MDGDVRGNTAVCLLNGKPIALLFGPDKRLVPVNPGFAQFNSAPLILDGVSPSAKAITCLKNNRAEPPLHELACSSSACQSSANNNIPLR